MACCARLGGAGVAVEADVVDCGVLAPEADAFAFVEDPAGVCALPAVAAAEDDGPAGAFAGAGGICACAGCAGLFVPC